MEAIPKDEADYSRRFRGYVAIDNIVFKPGKDCIGHCTFDSGFCGFQNVGGDSQDDFDWEIVRLCLN